MPMNSTVRETISQNMQVKGGNMANKLRSTWLFGFIYLIVCGAFSGAGAESEFKDTPFFSGMPNYKIIDAADQGFADYRFFNGKECITVEGRKHHRAYTLRKTPNNPATFRFRATM